MDKNIVLFCNVLSISNRITLKILEHFEDYQDFINNLSSLKEIKGIDVRVVNRILKNKNLNLKEYLNRLNDYNINITFFGDKDYPKNLNYIDDPPLMLYYLGELKPQDEFGISIVGSRKCTSYGAWACKEIAHGLSKHGVSITSGLAYGIDKIAHEACLDNGCRTIAVVGNGLDKVYPPNHKELYDRISHNGVIISEYPLGMDPKPYNFPYRNRIISGIGQGLVVIEAQKKSGTLITANYAAEQGKEVFALPGNINSFYSMGTNALIRDGAKIITELDDILDEIYYPKTEIEEEININFKDEFEKNIFEFLLNSPCTCDILSDNLGMPIEKVNATLTKLEIKGLVTEEMGGIFYPIVRKEG